MSVGKRAASGALWSVASSVGARVVGLIGTLYMTRLLAPEVVGEVSAAMVLAQSANWMSNWGFNHYMIVRGPDSPAATYHCAMTNWAFAVVGLAIAALVGPWFAPVFNAPDLAAYLPGLIVSVFIRRVGAVPDKILARELRFRELAIANGMGELAFTATALSLAGLTDLGGHAIVIGNIVQSVLTTGLIVGATGWRWFERSPWDWGRFRAIMKFGAPVGAGQVFNFASRYWDNLAFAHFFGTGVAGTYNMAYNLADIPAVQVGEQMTGVLLPAMASLTPEQRKAAVIRSTGLMAMAVFPLAVGLGAVSDSLIALLLSDEWQGVAPLLTVLSVLSVVRPMAWGVSSYLASFGRNRTLMILEAAKVVLLFACIFAFASLGPRWAAASVGIAFGVQSLITIGVVVTTDGIAPGPMIAAFVRPLLACAAMAGAVIGTRYGLGELGVTHPAILTAVEIVVGAAAYVPAAFLFARPIARDFLAQLKRALRRG
ncbi:MAG: oligosaccharide flippase family protein [Kofleriaceae bacterium]|jgi:lipopolysaccharide exporter|nr:oligosaccharide flippase family protein [Kofleriaceae bacterium]MBP9171534.1 oligosaccharide flippase family protein [Kofleriaceae bacterium]MBP9860181.1 oligosaccharide flippase family protein [Kofleriaceae bacterium]